MFSLCLINSFENSWHKQKNCNECIETKRKISHIAKNVRTSNAQCSWWVRAQHTSTAQRKSRHQAKFRRKNLIPLLVLIYYYVVLFSSVAPADAIASISLFPSSTLIYYRIELACMCGTAAHFSLILNRFATLFEFQIYLFLATMKHFHLNKTAFETQAATNKTRRWKEEITIALK